MCLFLQFWSNLQQELTQKISQPAFCEISHCNSASPTVTGLLCTVHYFVLYDIYFIIIIIIIIIIIYIYIYIYNLIKNFEKQIHTCEFSHPASPPFCFLHNFFIRTPF